jgi:Na+-driven multidrug efflux pump
MNHNKSYNIGSNSLRYSLSRINYRLFGVLVLMGLLPTLYTTIRIRFLGDLPGDWGYNIASQLTWLNVTYEVVHEALMLPMFFLVGRFLSDRKRFSGIVSNGLLLVGALYAVLSIITVSFARPMVVFMAQRSDLIGATITYIRLEAIALVFVAVVRYFTLILIILKRGIYLVVVLGLQAAMSVVLDTLFISALPFSLQFGVNGIAYTNIIVNGVLIAVLLFMLRRESVGLFGKDFTFDTAWLSDWFRIGGLSGLESFVRNAAFVLMVIRLVNVVQEQGTFWVTNSFIWGWLLIPVLALGELIKRDVSENEDAVTSNTPAYLFITALVVMVWVATIPLWRGFIHNVMGVANADAVFTLSLISLGFYVVFAFNNIADSVFYGRGRTDLMLYQSLAVNIIYYGGAFVLYQTGAFVPTLIGIALMFGIGIAIDSVITFIMFGRFRRRLGAAG